MLSLISDEDMHGKVVSGLFRRESRLDLVRAQDVGLVATPDPEILEWAESHGRVVLTRDRQTMVGAAFQRVQAGLAMPGVIVVNEAMEIGDAIDQALIVIHCCSADDIQDRVIFLPLR